MNFTMPVLSRPPRNVPLTTKLAVLGGGIFTTFGWFFFAFGLVFTWVFVGNADWTSAFSFHGQLENATGYITSVEKTSFSVGGSKHSSGTPIYAYHYKFYFSGADHEGTSYRTGERSSNDQLVPVEFPAGHPETSRIQGMRCAPMGLEVLFVLIFPLVGLGIVIPSTLIARKNLRLLANGELAQGRIVNKEPTNVRVNHRTVYKFTLEYTDASGQVQQTTVKTEEVEKLESKPFERLFYNPKDPTHCVALDCLPGKQGFDERGELLPNSVMKAIGVLCLPTISVLMMLGGIWWTFFKK